MNELRFVAACLEGEGICFPSPENNEKDAVRIRKEAEEQFQKLLNDLPTDKALALEDGASRIVSAWAEENFERGFVAGMRLAAQVFVYR